MNEGESILLRKTYLRPKAAVLDDTKGPSSTLLDLDTFQWWIHKERNL